MHKVLAIALAIPLAGATLAMAADMPKRSITASHSDLLQVRLFCNASHCIDPRTGAYTYSGCSYRGCYPTSGVVGYTNPQGGGPGYGFGWLFANLRVWPSSGYQDYNGD
jgi:hypothetical protein